MGCDACHPMGTAMDPNEGGSRDPCGPTPRQGSQQQSESGGVARDANSSSPPDSPETLFQSGQLDMSASTVQNRVRRVQSEPQDSTAGMCESDYLGCRMYEVRGDVSRGLREEKGDATNCSDCRPPPQQSISLLPVLSIPS